MLRRSRGFTLLELVLSLAAIALILQGFYAWKAASLAEAAVQRTVDGLVLVDEAAYAFHVEHGRWPASLAELRDPAAPLLPVVSGGTDPLVNGVGGAYLLALIPPDLGIRVTTSMQTHAQALRVQRSFPHRMLPVVSGSTDVVFEQRVAPKDSTDHELLVWRDGSREMRGHLDFDGHEARRVRRVEFQGFDAEGGACSGRRLASRSDGTLMECFNLKWRPVGASGGPECMWTGWEIVTVVRWGQSRESTTPRGLASASVVASWCDGGKVTHVKTTNCTAAPTWGNSGMPGFSVSGCRGLANPP